MSFGNILSESIRLIDFRADCSTLSRGRDRPGARDCDTGPLASALTRLRCAQLNRRAVSAPSKAWRFLRGESPLWERANHPPIPSVATMEEGEGSEDIAGEVTEGTPHEQ